MSWFSVGPSGPNLHPVQLAHDQEALFGPLVPADLEWACQGGFITETQTFYATTSKGGLVMCQVIHSAVGLWYPSIQFTFRYVDRAANKSIWKSIPVTNFVPGAGNPKLDKRSTKSDQFTITVEPSSPNKYQIQGKYDDEVNLSLTFDSLTPGWKVGAGPRGGMTYFGSKKEKSAAKGDSPDTAAGGDGYCIHRFFPRCAVSGIIRIGNDVIDMAGARGVFIHAVQGMRPNVLAAKWNFANFQSPAESDEGVSLQMMEFETTPSFGSKKINIGSIVIGDKLVAITAGGEGVIGKSVAQHENSVLDAETGYKAPGAITYSWAGQTLGGEGNALKMTGQGETKATLKMDLLTSTAGEPYATKGLVEKVDVLGQIPYLVKKFVNYAAGTKPFIYTWLNPAEAEITTAGPESKTIKVQGTVFVEATFIS